MSRFSGECVAIVVVLMLGGMEGSQYRLLRALAWRVQMCLVVHAMGFQSDIPTSVAAHVVLGCAVILQSRDMDFILPIARGIVLTPAVIVVFNRLVGQ